METRLVQRFAQHQTSKALWDSLAITYGSSADPLQIYDLEIQASKMSQEDQTLEEFWSELHNIWNEIDQRDPNPLECCDKGILTYQKIISQKRLYQFLVGLNPQLDGIRRDILKEKPNPSPEVAFATVKREAARLHIMQPVPNSGGLDPNIGVGLGVKHPNPRSDPARMQSNHNSANRFGQSSSRNKIDKTKLVC
ncbi:Unknown protein [Striga hermonthica]|uniref:Retrotransposon gag domain-containing protein n=1 Tax=Striga hermonthica TaxID=68872 RepID=A0A9N7MWG6_STRHE|nr:Unknown protein [Striga hermonthica]